MRSIDDINAEIEANGYANLTDEEINAFTEWKCNLATRDAEFQKKLETYDAELKSAVAAYNKMAENAINRLNELVAKPLALLEVEDA